MHAGLVATPVATEESSEEAVAAISQTLQPVVSLFALHSGTAVNFLLHHVPLLSMQSCSLPRSLRLSCLHVQPRLNVAPCSDVCTLLILPFLCLAAK